MKTYIYSIFLFVSTSAFAVTPENLSVISRGELIRVIGGLLCVLLVILLLSWLIKRLNGVQLSSAKGFQTIATMTLGPKERITLLKVGEQHLLIGLGTGSVNMLYDFGAQCPSGFDKQEKTGFAELLTSAMRKST